MSDNSVLRCQRKKSIDVTEEFSDSAEAPFYLGTFSSFLFLILDSLSWPLVKYAEIEIEELNSSSPKLQSSC